MPNTHFIVAGVEWVVPRRPVDELHDLRGALAAAKRRGSTGWLVAEKSVGTHPGELQSELLRSTPIGSSLRSRTPQKQGQPQRSGGRQRERSSPREHAVYVYRDILTFGHSDRSLYCRISTRCAPSNAPLRLSAGSASTVVDSDTQAQPLRCGAT